MDFSCFEKYKYHIGKNTAISRNDDDPYLRQGLAEVVVLQQPLC